MSEILRKFKTEFPTLNTICVDCGDVFARHNGWECPSNPVRMAFSTELTPLREIKDKLDALAKELTTIRELVGYSTLQRDVQQGFLGTYESQGKLLARLDALDAGLHETAMRNHQQVRVTLDEIMNGRKLNSEKWEIECNRAKRIEDYLLWLVEHTPPRKASKKARSAVGKAR